MTRYLTRDRIAILAALAVAAVLLPFRASWSNTNVARLLVVVGVAAIGNRVAGGLVAVCAGAGTLAPRGTGRASYSVYPCAAEVVRFGYNGQSRPPMPRWPVAWNNLPQEVLSALASSAGAAQGRILG